MDMGLLRRCAVSCVFTNHARLEMEGEEQGIISVDDVLQALAAGEIIDEYPDDKPYPSCLVLGRTGSGQPLHVVCAPVIEVGRLIVITAYRPDPKLWDADFKRRTR